MIEKRKASRIPVSMRVDCQGIDPIAFGYAQNFSLQGMALVVHYQNHHDISPNESVVLKFILPGSATALSLKAKITRISQASDKETLIGVQFSDLSELAFKELSFFMATQST
ncbi:MAG TPA: PilZ domain-containing protein [Oligoflexia bacterium]|nr:PilZ domain-containing protein [Oligoflexia bacterium]HMR25582.1 PilZ domain-containing protein [Oligoflexia bacterium]